MLKKENKAKTAVDQMELLNIYYLISVPCVASYRVICLVTTRNASGGYTSVANYKFAGVSHPCRKEAEPIAWS